MRPRARFSIFNGKRFMGDIDIVGYPAKQKNGSWWMLTGFILSGLVVLLCLYLLFYLIFLQ